MTEIYMWICDKCKNKVPCVRMTRKIKRPDTGLNMACGKGYRRAKPFLIDIITYGDDSPIENARPKV